MSTGEHRPTRAVISLSAIQDNFQQIKAHVGDKTKMIAVVKADAYGHGAVPVATALVEAGADYLAVAVSDEALELRQAGIEAPLFVLGITEPADAVLHAGQNIEVTVSSLDWLKSACDYIITSEIKPLHVHLKIDTGMGRIGVHDAGSAQEIIDFIEMHEDQFVLESIFTHMATADSSEASDVKKVKDQIRRFQDIRESIDTSGLKHQPFYHQSNSALSLWYPEATLDAVRPGIALYGINPSNGGWKLPISLKPALSLETEIVYTKKMSEGETVSYGATYEASEGEWLGTLPIGYADGWQRRYSGLDTIVDGKASPTVGRICMDQCMIRLPKYYPEGTKVTLIGQDGALALTVEEIGDYCETIGYEVVCLLTERIPRVYNSR